MSHNIGHSACPRLPSPLDRGAFTLIELLVVISLITMLISMLLPALGAAKEQGRRAKCSSQLRQQMVAVLAYATEHQDRMPAFHHASYSTPDADDWLMGRDTNVFTCVGKGSVFRYAPDREIYRCPSLAPGVYRSGVGSNGGFDYALFIAFAGTKLQKIPSTAQFKTASGDTLTLPVPILCEEDPPFHINSSSPEPGHCAWDQQGKWHGGGGFYSSLDASTHFFRPGSSITPAAYWSAKKPDGVSIGLDNWWGAQNYDSWGKF
ncbi:MAG: type II secretion system protein [Phycisphaeraceae bacterium]